jgi:hypothetical protein
MTVWIVGKGEPETFQKSLYVLVLGTNFQKHILRNFYKSVFREQCEETLTCLEIINRTMETKTEAYVPSMESSVNSFHLVFFLKCLKPFEVHCSASVMAPKPHVPLFVSLLCQCGLSYCKIYSVPSK